MPDEQLDILIRLLADKMGADEVEASLDRVKKGTKDLKQTTAETKAEITDGMNPALISMAENHDEAAKAAAHAELSHKALGFGLRQLGSEAMEAGHALLIGFSNPTAAGFLVLTILLGKFIGEWEKVREAAAEDVDFQGMEKMAKALGEEGMLKTLRDGSVGLADYFDGLHRLTNEQRSLKAATDDAVDALKKQSEADSKEISEREKGEILKIDALKKSGAITEEEANKRKAAVHDRVADEQAQNQAITQGDEIRKRKEELDTINKRYNARVDKSSDAQQASTRADAEVQRLQIAREEAEKRQRAAEEMLSKHQTEILKNETYQKELKSDIPAVRNTAALLWNPKLKSMNEYEQQKMLAMDQKVEIEERTLPRAQEEANRRKRDAEEAKKKVDEDVTRKKELEPEIARLEADKKRDDETRAREHKTRSQEKAFGGDFGPTAVQDLTQAQKVAGAIADYQKLTSGQDMDRSTAHREQVFKNYRESATAGGVNQLMDTASVTAGKRVDLQTAVAMMQKGANDQDVFAQQVVSAVANMGKIGAHTSTLAGHVATIDAQVKQLQAQMKNLHH